MLALNTLDYDNIESALRECVSIDEVCLSVIEDNNQFNIILKRTLDYKNLITKIKELQNG